MRTESRGAARTSTPISNSCPRLTPRLPSNGATSGRLPPASFRLHKLPGWLVQPRTPASVLSPSDTKAVSQDRTKAGQGPGLEGTGAQSLCPLPVRGCPPPSTSVPSPTCNAGISMVASACRQDGLLTQFPAPRISPENERLSLPFLLMAWSFW